MLEEKIEDRYISEDFHWVASVPVRIPWYRCTLECTVIREQAMSELDQIFCKCVLARICTAGDIAFVLSLDPRIVQGELNALENDGLLQCTDGVYLLTEVGTDCFSRHARAQKCTEEYDVCLNGVTGKWSVEPPAQTAGGPEALTLQPLLAAEWRENEDTEALCKSLDGARDGRILSTRFRGASATIYQEELMLVYQKEDRVKLAFLDPARDDWDIDTGAALDRRYERRELLELLQVEAMVRKQQQQIESRLAGAVQLRFCRNREIREMLKSSFSQAQSSVFIISPWLDHNNYVITETLLSDMERAMQRGVRVEIGYGYLPGEKREKMLRKMERGSEQARQDNREWQTEQMALRLRQRFAGLPFELFYVGTHEKILIIDGEYGYVGSFNLLSYDGGEQYEFSDFLCRREGGMMFRSPEVVEQIREDFRRFQAS